jgi:hypothetical protein
VLPGSEEALADCEVEPDESGLSKRDRRSRWDSELEREERGAGLLRLAGRQWSTGARLGARWVLIALGNQRCGRQEYDSVPSVLVTAASAAVAAHMC